MDIITAIGLCAVALTLLWIGGHWMRKRLERRLISEVPTSANTNEGRPKLVPESLYVVEISDTDIRCVGPDGRTESVSWNDLQKVEIVTTDRGPFVPDVFWVLHGSSRGCVIPQGATCEDALIERLQTLPYFRNDVIIEAMSVTTNNRLLCWERATGTEQIEAPVPAPDVVIKEPSP